MLEILEDNGYYYCIMEKANGGSLVDHLLDKHPDGVMPEEDLKQMMRDMLEAVGHVHKQGVLHRDLKPDNFVVRRMSDPGALEEPDQILSWRSSRRTPGGTVERVALIDFDHADSDYSPRSASPRSESVFGTQGFNAPEQYLGHSSAASDLWSIGVILYLFMTGTMPYDLAKLEKQARMEHRNFSKKSDTGNNWLSAVYYKMMGCPPKWDCDPWTQSKACSDFCRNLLAFKTESRPQTAEEALCHPWLAKDECQLIPLVPQNSKANLEDPPFVKDEVGKRPEPLPSTQGESLPPMPDRPSANEIKSIMDPVGYRTHATSSASNVLQVGTPQPKNAHDAIPPNLVNSLYESTERGDCPWGDITPQTPSLHPWCKSPLKKGVQQMQASFLHDREERAKRLPALSARKDLMSLRAVAIEKCFFT